MQKIILSFLFLMFSFAVISNAQNVIRGTIRNSVTNEGAPAVSVTIKNSSEGTYTDDRGRFQIKTGHKLPVTLVVSSIGFKTKEISVTDFSPSVDVKLEPGTELGEAAGIRFCKATS